VILSKRNELGILSNFAPTPFTLHGKRYASVEGFWQMMLYPENSNDPRAKFPGIRRSLPADRRGHAREVGTEPPGETDAALHRPSHFSSRPLPGTKPSRRMALFPDLDGIAS
jgi:hypothetical protein